jgi:c-di-GMP-binding flagellar brake protein YcgR
MQDSDNKRVHAAIARNAGIVISLPSAGILRHHKSRFLAESEEGIWVEAPPAERALINELILSRQPTGISFRHGPVKIIFSAPICRHDPEYRINNEMTVEAVLAHFPAEVKTIQRRSNYRVAVPGDSDLHVRVWRLGPGVPVRDRPMAKQEVKAKLRDISLGGVGVLLEGEGDEPPKISEEDRLRVSLQSTDHELILEGHLRHPNDLNGPTIRAGIQFNGLEKDIDGRQTLATLTRIVGELTRAELRRIRIRMTARSAA